MMLAHTDPGSIFRRESAQDSFEGDHSSGRLTRMHRVVRPFYAISLDLKVRRPQFLDEQFCMLTWKLEYSPGLIGYATTGEYEIRRTELEEYAALKRVRGAYCDCGHVNPAPGLFYIKPDCVAIAAYGFARLSHGNCRANKYAVSLPNSLLIALAKAECGVTWRRNKSEGKKKNSAPDQIPHWRTSKALAPVFIGRGEPRKLRQMQVLPSAHFLFDASVHGIRGRPLDRKGSPRVVDRCQDPGGGDCGRAALRAALHGPGRGGWTKGVGLANASLFHAVPHASLSN